MAKQKHNTYYNENTPGSGIYYYNENGEPKKVDVGSTYSAGSGIKIENDIISVSGKYVASADSSLDGKSLILKDNKWTELIMPPSSNWLPTIKEASANSYNAATAWTNAQGYLTAHQIIPSAKWENASDVVVSNSANWNNSYTALTANSADWLKEADIAHLATKDELNTASSTLTGQTHYLSGKIDGVTADINYLSGQIDNKLDETIYASHSGKWETASDKVEASSNYWNSVYDTVNDNSAKWDSVAESANYWNLAYNEFTENSGAWNETTQKVNDSADTWNTVTAKADQEDLETLSGELETVSSFIEEQVEWLDDAIEEVSGDVKTISGYVKTISADVEKKLDKDDFTAWSAQTTAWDVDEYTGIDPIKVENHEISLTADYLSANALDNLSGNWESTYKTVETNSGKWETAYETLTSNSADWDEVSAKLNSSTFAIYSADIKSTIKSFSGEFVELSGNFTAHSADSDLHLSAGEREKWTDAANRVENSAAIWDTVSAKVNKTEFEELKTSAHYELEKKLDKNSFESWSANKDYDFYSAGNGIKIENHIVSVSADYALSADVDNRLGEYYNKTEVDEKFADFGGFVVVTTLPVSGDNKKIYLINDPTSPNPDQYKEYIYTENVWKCIGDTSVDLTQYYKKTETSSRQEISTEFTNTSAWANDTFQPIGDYVTSGNYITAGPAWVLVNDDNNIQWSGLDVSELGKKYIVKSTNGTIGVGSATVGNVVTYDLSGAKIVGENGVSAKYNPDTNEWNVGLEEQTYCYAEAQSHNTTTTGLTEVLSNFENITCVGEDIEITSSTITMNKGLYHIDIQVNVTNTTTAPQYYDVSLTNSLNNGALTKVFDGSFTHTETLDLSFDVKLLNNSNSLTFTLTNMPIGSEYYVRNLQIHEIVTIDGLLDFTGGQYTGGTAIGISNENVINVKYDSMSGIGVTPDNKLYVKLGKGLSFSNEGGVDGTLSLDEVTEGVVETVQTLEKELNGKLTTNMNISDAKDIGSMFKNNTVASLACSLFTVPLQHNLTTASEISFFTTQGMNQSNSFPIIIGLYEYNFDYFDPDTHQYRSQTTWLGDTGPIMNDTQDVKGHAIGGGPNKYTFKLKHLTPVVSADITWNDKIYHNEYGPVMRSDRAYYLAVFARHTDGLNYVLGDAGYNAVTNSDPFISWYADNMHYVYPDKTSATMDDNWDGWGNDLSLSAIDFWNRGGEANAIVRPLVMIRNVSE